MISALALLIALGTASQWLAWRLKLPSILLLLAVGLLGGPVVGFLSVEQAFGGVLLPFVSLAISIILFEGGLTLKRRELKEAGKAVWGLIIIGSLVTLSMTVLAARYVAGTSWEVAACLGGLLIVTGPTVIVPLLQQVRIDGRVGNILRWEGMINDPLGAITAVLLLEGMVSRPGLGYHTVLGMGTALTVALVVAGLLGFLLYLLFRHHVLPDHLHNPVVVATILGAFVISNAAQEESGLLTVTLLGILLANQKSVHLEHVLEFKENLRVLLIGILFLALTARVEPDLLYSLGWRDLAFVLILVVLVRPIAVLLATLDTDLSHKEKFMLALIAPRGIVAAAVSSLFAIRLSEAGVADANRLLALTFLTIVVTVIVSGLLAAPVARRLGFAHPNPQGVLLIGASAPARQLAGVLKSLDIETFLVDSNRRHVRAARDAGLDAVAGNALSPRTQRRVDLFGLNKAFALIPADAANTLVALHYMSDFGRSQVFQLSPQGDTEEDSSTEPVGRSLFSPGFTADEMRRRWAEGHRFRLVDSATEIPEEALVCMTTGEGGSLHVCTTQDESLDQAHQLIVFGPR